VVCKQLGDEGIAIIDTKWIDSVVAMIPFSRPGQDGDAVAEFYLVEKMSLGYTKTNVPADGEDE